MNNIFLLALAASFFALPTIAQSDCTGIAVDEERLACYDLESGFVASKSENSGIGHWIKRVDVSQLTDDKNVFLNLQSENEMPARFRGAGPATLLLRCMENTTSAFFLFNGHFMSDIQGRGKIEYRIDDKSMRSINTQVSTDNEALGLWNGGKSIPFIKQLIGGQRLVVRATPHSESAMTANFDIRGIDEAVNELRETCNW